MRKAWLRYAIVFANLAVTMLFFIFVSWPMPYLEFVESALIPKYEQSFGFRAGRLPRSIDLSTYAIVQVEPDGRLDRAGVKSGDLPYEPQGYGIGPFYDALRRASEGEESAFWVISDRDDYLGKGAHRIVLKAEATLK